MTWVHGHPDTVAVALACLLTMLLQLHKRYVRTLRGWSAVGLLLAASVALVAPAGGLGSVEGWARVILLAGLAAGIHGTAKLLALNSGDPRQSKPPSGNGPNPTRFTSGPPPGKDQRVRIVGDNPLNTSSNDPQLR